VRQTTAGEQLPQVLVQPGRFGQHFLHCYVALLAACFHHAAPAPSGVAQPFCARGPQALPERVQTLVRYFRERPQPIPTLYVMGEEAHMFLAPVIEQCGHVCNMEQPVQFNRTTLDFITCQVSVANP